MHALGGGGLGMLVLLQRWAQDHDIRFKLFNPSTPVRDKLNHIDFEIATLEQMMTLLSRIESPIRGSLVRGSLARIAISVASAVAVFLTAKEARPVISSQLSPVPISP